MPQKLIQLLIFIWLVLMPWQRIWSLPMLEERLQPGDVFFMLALMGTVFLKPGALFHRDRIRRFFPMFILVGFVGLQAVVLKSASVALEGVALLYVMLIAYVVSTWLEEEVLSLKQLSLGVIAGLTILLLLCLPAWYLRDWSLFTSWWRYRVDYPFLGKVYLLAGPSPHPIIMAHYLVWGLCLLPFGFPKQGRTNAQLWLAVLLGVGLLLTVNKTLIYFLGALLLVAGSTHQIWRRWLFIAGLGCWVFAWTATHFVVTTSSALEDKPPPYSLYKQVYSGDQFELWASSYTLLKEKQLQVFSEKPLLGSGYGRFVEQSQRLHDAGDYPPHIPPYDAHSAFIGLLAETGLVGSLLALLMILYFTNRLKKLDPHHYASLFLFFLLYFAEGWVTDWWHFRSLWVMVGVVMGVSGKG